jgi:hypothetical protein
MTERKTWIQVSSWHQFYTCDRIIIVVCGYLGKIVNALRPLVLGLRTEVQSHLRDSRRGLHYYSLIPFCEPYSYFVCVCVCVCVCVRVCVCS